MRNVFNYLQFSKLARVKLVSFLAGWFCERQTWRCGFTSKNFGKWPSDQCLWRAEMVGGQRRRPRAVSTHPTESLGVAALSEMYGMGKLDGLMEI